MPSSAAHTGAPTPQIKRIPNPDEPRPRLAWPTILLLLGGVGTWALSSALALTGLWPWPLSVILNTLASFALFTVVHESCHRSISTVDAVNVWCGRLAAMFIGPFSGLGMFRFIHMQHHRFTNDHDLDPDHWANVDAGPQWTLPLRWITLDLNYLPYYARRVRSRPSREKVELTITLAATTSILLVATLTGHLLDAILLWLLPQRLAILILGWSFDYLPHHGLTATHKQNPYKATRNRVGLERLLTPVLLYQNYHLVHHLHPLIPFYRYIAVWRRREDDYLAHDPALSTAGGRELTVEEYRRIRELATH